MKFDETCSENIHYTKIFNVRKVFKKKKYSSCGEVYDHKWLKKKKKKAVGRISQRKGGETIPLMFLITRNFAHKFSTRAFYITSNANYEENFQIGKISTSQDYAY